MQDASPDDSPRRVRPAEREPTSAKVARFLLGTSPRPSPRLKPLLDASSMRSWILVRILLVLAGSVTAAVADVPYLWAFRSTASTSASSSSDSTTSGVTAAAPGAAEAHPAQVHRIVVESHGKAWFRQLLEAENHLSRGRRGEAVNYYKTVLRKYHLPEHDQFEIHMTLGAIFTNMSQLEEAEVSFQYAASACAQMQAKLAHDRWDVRGGPPPDNVPTTWDPHAHLPQFALGVVFTKQGRFEEAIEAYERALFIRPDFFPALSHLGALHFLRGQRDLAWYFIRSAVRKWFEGHEGGQVPTLRSLIRQVLAHPDTASPPEGAPRNDDPSGDEEDLARDPTLREAHEAAVRSVLPWFHHHILATFRLQDIQAPRHTNAAAIRFLPELSDPRGLHSAGGKKSETALVADGGGSSEDEDKSEGEGGAEGEREVGDTNDDDNVDDIDDEADIESIAVDVGGVDGPKEAEATAPTSAPTQRPSSPEDDWVEGLWWGDAAAIATRLALLVHPASKALLPFHWHAIHMNLGLALQNIGAHDEGTTHLRLAVDAAEDLDRIAKQMESREQLKAKPPSMRRRTDTHRGRASGGSSTPPPSSSHSTSDVLATTETPKSNAEKTRLLRGWAARAKAETAWIPLFLTLTMPVVFESATQVRLVRAQLDRDVQEALRSGLRPHDPHRLRELYTSLYLLPFMGLPHRHVAIDIARLIARTRQPLTAYASPLLLHRYPETTKGGHGSTSDRNDKPKEEEEEEGEEEEDDSHRGIRSTHSRRKPPRRPHPVPLQAASASASTSTARSSSTPQATTETPNSSPSATVRVGVLSYQFYDNPVGHLFHRLIDHLTSYRLHRDRWANGTVSPDTAAGSTTKGSMGAGSVHDLPGIHVKLDTDEPTSQAPLPPALEAALLGAPRTPNRAPRSPPARTDASCRRRWPSEPRRVVFPDVPAFHVTAILPRPFGDAVTRRILAAADAVVRLDSPSPSSATDSASAESERTPGSARKPFVPEGQPRESSETEATRRNASLPHTRDIDFSRAVLERLRLDVLIVADAGIDPFVYTLLHSRVAPVQIVYWGSGTSHTASLGLPNSVDYYVVGDFLASANLDARMAEQTVRLGAMGVFFTRLPRISEAEYLEAVAALTVLSNRRYYLCPRVLVAIHPAMDEVFGLILELDADAEIILLYEPKQELWLSRVRRRMRESLFIGEKKLPRIRFIAQLPRRHLWAMFLAASVVLDSFPVGLGIAAWEAMALGAPVVTLPARQPGRRPVAAILRYLDEIDDPCPYERTKDHDRVELDTDRDVCERRDQVGRKPHSCSWDPSTESEEASVDEENEESEEEEEEEKEEEEEEEEGTVVPNHSLDGSPRPLDVDDEGHAPIGDPKQGTLERTERRRGNETSEAPTEERGKDRVLLSDTLIAASVSDMAQKAVAVATNETLQIHLRRHLKRRFAALEWDEWVSPSSPRPASLDAACDAEDVDWEFLRRLRTRGFEDPARETLDDWLTFLARVGGPRAREREQAERLDPLLLSPTRTDLEGALEHGQAGLDPVEGGSPRKTRVPKKRRSVHEDE